MFRDLPPSPEDWQDYPQMQQEFGTVLVHLLLSEVPLPPGAELALGLQTTSLT